jgi:hypothetical protein
LDKNSILDVIKKLLGIDYEDDNFDIDVISDINTAIFELSQIGIGPRTGFMIMSREEKWSDYLGVDAVNLEGVKTCIHLKTKLIFDPPTNTTTIESIKNKIQELEWRLRLAVETNNLEGV